MAEQRERLGLLGMSELSSVHHEFTMNHSLQLCCLYCGYWCGTAGLWVTPCWIKCHLKLIEARDSSRVRVGVGVRIRVGSGADGSAPPGAVLIPLWQWLLPISGRVLGAEQAQFSPSPVCNVCALHDPFNATYMFTNAFYEPVASRITKPEQQQALFFFFLQCYSKEKKKSFIFVMYKFVHGIIVLCDTI